MSETGGWILAFISWIDNKGPGAHQDWDNQKAYNTEQEKNLLVPGFNYYWELAQELIKNRITVDLFSCTHSNIDLAYISSLCIDTGGDLYYYKMFSDRYDYEKMMYDVFRILTWNNAYDVSFRLRCSEGYSV